MAPASKEKLQTLVITIVSSLLAAGGGSFVVNNDIVSRLQAAETTIAVMQSEKTGAQKTVDKIDVQLDELSTKIEEGQKYIRDEVMPVITDLKVDVATLKARR